MKNLRIISTLGILFACIHLQAQNTTNKNTLSIGWGINNIKTQDLIFSPMIKSDWSPVSAFIEFSHSGQMEHHFSAKYSHFEPAVFDLFSFYWETPEDMVMSNPSTYDHLDISYSLGKSLVERNGFKLILGGRSINRLHPNYTGMAGDDLFGYFFSFGLDAWAKIKYSPNDIHSFTANLALPIFSFIARSAYMWQDDKYFEDIYHHSTLPTLLGYIEDAQINSWGKAQHMDLDITYSYSLSDKWSIGMSYWLSLIRNQYPKNMTSIENGIYLKANYKF